LLDLLKSITYLSGIMNDRQIGYVLIGFLAALIVSTALWSFWVSLHPADVLVVRFPRSGNLKIQDPVAARGIIIGKVRSMVLGNGKAPASESALDDSSVIVSVAVARPIPICRNYRVITLDRNLMGDRYVEIDPGDPSQGQLSSHDTLNGEYVASISDAIGLMGKLKLCVDSFIKTSAIFLDGDQHRESFCKQFNGLARAADSASVQLLEFCREYDRNYAKGLDTLGVFLSKAAVFSAAAARQAREYRIKIERLFVQADSLVQLGERAIDTVGPVMEKLKDPEGLLLNERIVKMKKQIEDLRMILQDVRMKGVPLPVQIIY
jgi:hypothetical protein